MVEGYVCSVCAMRMNENNNPTGLANLFGDVLYLCIRHHDAGARVASEDGEVNWYAMRAADRVVEEERPPLDDSEAWARWSPVDRLVEVYRELAGQEVFVDAQEEERRMAAG